MSIRVRKLPLRKAAALLAMAMVSVAGAWAQLEDGKVYNFRSVGSGGNSLSYNADFIPSVTKTDTSDYRQLWLAEEHKEQKGRFSLRNLGSGLYLRNSLEREMPWSLVGSFEIDEACYNYCPRESNNNQNYTMSDQANGQGYQCMHINGVIKSWEFKHSHSRWNLTLVGKTKEEIDEQLKKVAYIEDSLKSDPFFMVETHKKSLAKIFTDQACTVLSPGYASMTEEQLAQDPDFKQLSPILQQMVRKVKTGDWTEDNQFAHKPKWDSEYAKKFRVQLYEPYSNPHEAGRALRIQPHSVMNNPTGIYAKKGDVVYVMVEGKIEEGSELWFSTFQGYNRPIGDVRKGMKLKEGLNIVRYNQDSTNTFVCYTVETFLDRKPTGRKLSSYKDLKIHIEGGHLNGYYNRMGDSLYTPDKNKDWEYYEQRANMPAITILGKYQILHLYQDSTRASDGKIYPGLSSIMNERITVEEVIDAWDNLMMYERLTLGVLSRKEIEEANRKYPTLDDPSRGIYTYMGNDSLAPIDYSDTYRVHGMAWGMLNGYMVGSNGYSGYHISTFDAITRGMASRTSMNFDNIWGPAHEIGHQHQEMLHMHGLKESSNNIFSNVALWYDGKATSRMSNGKLLNLLDVFNRADGDFFHTTLYVQTHLYYKLWLYYHLAGKNNKFYPRLFEMLRKNPMQLTAPAQDGAKSLLHFYKMCCRAAGEDLTDFFRAHCFFTPMYLRYVGDYTSTSYSQTQEQVDAAIAEVKSWNLPVNRNLIFINDCAGKTTYSHDGKTKRVIHDGVQANLGMYTDFIHPEASPVTGTYAYHYNEGKIEMTGGQGGVGFLAYDDEGVLQAFSDCYVFPLSERAAKKLSLNRLRFFVIDGAGQLTEIFDSNMVGTQRELLLASIRKAEKLLEQVDPKSRCVGFYHPKAAETLKELLAKAHEVYEQKTQEAYLPVYYQLMEEVARLTDDADARIAFVPNSEYLLECEHSPNKYVVAQADSTLLLTDDETKAGKWFFEEADAESFYIKDAQTGKYMSSAENGKLVTLVEKGQTAPYRLQTVDKSFFAYFGLNSGKGFLKYNGNKVQGVGNIDGKQSRWRLQLLDVQETEQVYQDLRKVANQAEALVRKVTEMKEVKLQTTDSMQTAYLYCNAPKSADPSVNGSAANGYNLLDHDLNTFLLTVDNEKVDSKDKLDHYLRVDLKEQQLKVVSMRYVTRNADGEERPKHILIEGSQDGNVYTPMFEVSKGLPNHLLSRYETQLLNAGNYRFLRFMVKATYGNKKSMNHPYFSLASFGIYRPELLARYSGTASELAALYDALNEARSAMWTHKNDLDRLRQVKEKLDRAYAAFAQACQRIENEEYSQKQAQLDEIIRKTEELIAEIGQVKVEEGSEISKLLPLALQCKEEDKKGYIMTNADQNVQTGTIQFVCDNNTETFFHSRWSGTAVNEPHYLKIKVADVASDAGFRISYTTRHNGGPYPTAFRVECSEDGSNFTAVQSFTEAEHQLPTAQRKKWVSDIINPTVPYKYVRMVVTKSTDFKLTQYCYALAELSIDTCEYKMEVQTEIKENLSCVTHELLGAVSLTKTAAETINKMAASDEVMAEQLAVLQHMHDSLLKAKNASAAYSALQAYSQTPYLPCYELKAGTKVGQWNAQGVEAYNKAYRRAAALLRDKGAAASDYEEALKPWQDAFAALTVIQPEAGKCYTVRKADVKGNLYLHVDADNALQLSMEVDTTQSHAAWQFVTQQDKLGMKNLHTSAYLTTLAEGQSLQQEELATFILRPLANDGKVAITASADEKQGWYVEEVADPTQLGYDLTISSYAYAGLYLDYSARIPEGVRAYTVGAIKENVVTLLPVEGEVIPAATAVIVKGPAATYRFRYAADTPALMMDNRLQGASSTQIKQAEPGHAYYLFGVKKEQVGLYKAWLEYSADGTVAVENKGTDRGGHFRVSANKVYLPLASSATAAPLSFRFDEVQTGIAAPSVAAKTGIIYDLQGRRIHRVRQSGLYIVNGQKVYLAVPCN